MSGKANQNDHHVVIVGGGFGGLHAARRLAGARGVRVTLVDRRNFHLFQPLLYQVATGGLSPANIAAPIRAVLKRAENISVILGEATGIDVKNRRVVLSDGELEYDSLILATGLENNYFGHPEWERIAPGLKTIEDATRMRSRILSAFEMAEKGTDAAKMRAYLTFVIIGGGPTGVELAGALAEIAHHTLRRDFRRINPADAKIILVEASPRLLSAFPEKLSRLAERALVRLGVEVRTNSRAIEITEEHVVIKSGDAETKIPARTILWGAGIKGSPLGAEIARQTGVEMDKAGRIVVHEDLWIPGFPEIFVIGDLAHSRDGKGRELPAVAQVAMQQGDYAARHILNRLAGRATPPYRYMDYGRMATIGRRQAVADFHFIRFNGFFAWLAWLFIHLIHLVLFDNKMLVMFQWAWSYLTFNRSARLITNDRDSGGHSG
ncbi:MAG: NAD(P)/FAD-dependent oxidoreductase [bacterium]|jgi:NADH dehydrogenase